MVELPQLYVNIYKFGTWSLFIQNPKILLGALSFGSYNTAYITVVNNNGSAFAAIFPYQDALESFKSFGPIDSFKSLLTYIVGNLDTYAKVILYKIFAAMDVWYRDCYVPYSQVHKNNFIFRNINYLLYFSAALSPVFIRMSWQKFILLFFTFIPIFVAFLGHVETRYFIVLFVFVYIIVAFWYVENFKVVYEKLLKSKWLMFCTAAFLVLFLLLSNYLHAVIFSWSSFPKI